jgi:hypothetical protein
VPALENLSELSLNLDFPFDIAHPIDRRFYPTMPTRARVMALGGPFQPWLDYRQELAGHLHYGMRCFICYEVVGHFRHYKQIWGSIWCMQCYELYMLSMKSVRGNILVQTDDPVQILIKSQKFLDLVSLSSMAHTVVLFASMHCQVIVSIVLWSTKS